MLGWQPGGFAIQVGPQFSGTFDRLVLQACGASRSPWPTGNRRRSVFRWRRRRDRVEPYWRERSRSDRSPLGLGSIPADGRLAQRARVDNHHHRSMTSGGLSPGIARDSRASFTLCTCPERAWNAPSPPRRSLRCGITPPSGPRARRTLTNGIHHTEHQLGISPSSLYCLAYRFRDYHHSPSSASDLFCGWSTPFSLSSSTSPDYIRTSRISPLESREYPRTGAARGSRCRSPSRTACRESRELNRAGCPLRLHCVAEAQTRGAGFAQVGPLTLRPALRSPRPR